MAEKNIFELYRKTSGAAFEAALKLQAQYFENANKALKTALDFQRTGLELTKRNMQLVNETFTGWQETAQQAYGRWAEALKLEPQEVEKWRETFFKPVEENQKRALGLIQEQMGRLFELTQTNIERSEQTFTTLNEQARQNLESLLTQYDKAARTLAEAVEAQMSKFAEQSRANFSRLKEYWEETAKSLTASGKELKQLRKSVEELQAKVTKLEKAAKK